MAGAVRGRWLFYPAELGPLHEQVFCDRPLRIGIVDIP